MAWAHFDCHMLKPVSLREMRGRAICLTLECIRTHGGFIKQISGLEILIQLAWRWISEFAFLTRSQVILLLVQGRQGEDRVRGQS